MDLDKYFSGVPDSVLSGALRMDAGLARAVQKGCEAKGLFQDISFLEARQKLIEYDTELDDEADLDDMLEDDSRGRVTNFYGRLLHEAREYISNFSDEERRILASTGDDLTANFAIKVIMKDCGYSEVQRLPVHRTFKDKLYSLLHIR